MQQTTVPAPPRRGPVRRWKGARLGAALLAGQAALVAAAALIGVELNRRHVANHVHAPPLYAYWHPHVGPGTPAAVIVAVAVLIYGPQWTERAAWRRLLGASYLASLAWILSLALVDGWSRGFADRLTQQADYLHDVPRVGSIRAMLAGFSEHIVGHRPPGSWTTHVAGHPPGALLTFVVLDRIGLSGGVAAGFLAVLVGASATVSVAVALRRLGDEAAARAVLPFLVLFPGAVWIGVSADGLFTGVAAAGLALLAVAGWRAAALGGLLLGYSIYLSYGLVLLAALAAAVLALRHRARLACLAAATAGALAVAAAFTASGFWWPTGYRLVRIRYEQGWAGGRPYGYWIWADLACAAISAGPAVAIALRYALVSRPVPRWLPLAALAAIVAADLSGLSKAEVERIWLPYEIWLLPATAALPPPARRWLLALQAATALAVNHLLMTHS